MLDQVQFVSSNFNGERALDRVNGDHQLALVQLHEHSFQPMQATASNAHALSHLHEWVQGKRNLPLQQQLQVLNLRRRHWGDKASKANEPQQAGSLQNCPPRLARLIDVNEGVTWKPGGGDQLLPVAPPMVFGPQRKVCLTAFSAELRYDFLLVPVARLNRKPLRPGGNTSDNRRRGSSIATAH